MNSKLIEKFFKKACTPEEAQQVLDWFQDQDVQAWQENDLHALWNEAEKDKDEPDFSHDTQELLKMIHKKMDARQRTPTEKHLSRKLPRLPDAWAFALKVAVILIVPFLSIWFFVDFDKTESIDQAPILTTIETPAGMKRTKMLPDGSKVVLNSRSTITFEEDFTVSTREITLVGEAFFEVAKDSLRPFIVHSGSLSTTALGTSFNINYRPLRAITEVSLATGEVNVTNAQVEGEIMETRLKPGERLKYDLKKDSFHTDQFDSLETLAWKEGILYFKKAGIEEVIHRLEDWYGVKISLEGNTRLAKNQHWHYTGMFMNENLENVLTGIGYVKGFSFEIDGKNIKLTIN